MNSKKILIFGVFDGIHEGHLSFISDAKKEGDHLVAVVARDSIVENLKGKLPKYNEVERINELLKIPEVDLVLLGDRELSTYNVLKEVKPDVVFLGYDQIALHKDLNKAIKSGKLPEMEIISGIPYNPEVFHSSILNKKN
jgi:cytidyltransferase-like protein